MNPDIIFEDKELIVLNKPTGWVVNDARTTKGLTLQGWLKKKYSYSLAKKSSFRSGIVHRLDKETSGLLLVAKTEEAFSFLQDQFKKRKVLKKYLALVHGDLVVEKGIVNAPVGRLPWNRERFGVLPGGREAETGYEVVNRYEGKNKNIYSLLKLFPKTGRTHQIRIHLKYLGHSLVSDSMYAGRKTLRKDLTFCPRLFLHASEIVFIHPESVKKVKITSLLPEDLKASLAKLKKV